MTGAEVRDTKVSRIDSLACLAFAVIAFLMLRPLCSDLCFGS